MSRLLAGIGALAAAAVLVPFAAAGAAAHTVTGSGQLIGTNGVNRIFSFSAVQPDDGSVTGEVQLRTFGGETFHLQVTCLVVQGNKAVVGGVVTASSVPETVGLSAIFGVEDDPDLMTPLLLEDEETGPLDCSSSIARELLEFAAFPVQHGSISVR